MSRPEATPDLCVIGGSEAGLAACLGAVALGLSCVLVDDGDPSGLTNPDLALAALAKAALRPGSGSAAWMAMSTALARAAPDRRHARFAALNVRLVRGRGRFADATTLLAGNGAIRARRFFIATGGVQPAGMLVQALPTEARLTLKDIPRLSGAPRDLLVIGNGPHAVSATQSMARLGSRVTLVADGLLPGFDPELTAPLAEQLRHDRVTVVPGTLRMARCKMGMILANLSECVELQASHILLAEEDRPALDGLDLDRAGVTRRDGTLVLDAGLRTNRPHILAIGRAAGAQSTAEGVAQAGHALRSAFLPVAGRSRPTPIPRITATQPQVASVGLADGLAADRVWRWPLAHTGGLAPWEAAEGHVKVSTDRRGRIRHVGLVGPELRDLVPFWALAVAQGLTLADLASVVPPAPSWSELIRAIAAQDLGRRLSSPWVRRALRAARWLG